MKNSAKLAVIVSSFFLTTLATTAHAGGNCQSCEQTKPPAASPVTAEQQQAQGQAQQAAADAAAKAAAEASAKAASAAEANVNVAAQGGKAQQAQESNLKAVTGDQKMSSDIQLKPTLTSTVSTPVSVQQGSPTASAAGGTGIGKGGEGGKGGAGGAGGAGIAKVTDSGNGTGTGIAKVVDSGNGGGATLDNVGSGNGAKVEMNSDVRVYDSVGVADLPATIAVGGVRLEKVGNCGPRVMVESFTRHTYLPRALGIFNKSIEMKTMQGLLKGFDEQTPFIVRKTNVPQFVDGKLQDTELTMIYGHQLYLAEEQVSQGGGASSAANYASDKMFGGGASLSANTAFGVVSVVAVPCEYSGQTSYLRELEKKNEDLERKKRDADERVRRAESKMGVK